MEQDQGIELPELSVDETETVGAPATGLSKSKVCAAKCKGKN